MTVFIIVILGFFLYFAPAIVAYNRHKRNKASILVINIFLGWTVIGWIVALAMAYSKDTETNIVVQQQRQQSDAGELKKLFDLKEKGVITEEEFQSKKKKFLEL